MKPQNHFKKSFSLTCRIAVTAFCFLGIQSVVHAADVYASSRIKEVYPLSNGTFVLTFKDRNPACNNNGAGDPYFYVAVGLNGVTADGAKMILATALTAAAQGRVVHYVWDSANTSTCPINRLSVSF